MILVSFTEYYINNISQGTALNINQLSSSVIQVTKNTSSKLFFNLGMGAEGALFRLRIARKGEITICKNVVLVRFGWYRNPLSVVFRLLTVAQRATTAQNRNRCYVSRWRTFVYKKLSSKNNHRHSFDNTSEPLFTQKTAFYFTFLKLYWIGFLFKFNFLIFLLWATNKHFNYKNEIISYFRCCGNSQCILGR